VPQAQTRGFQYRHTQWGERVEGIKDSTRGWKAEHGVWQVQDPTPIDGATGSGMTESLIIVNLTI
jgi:hypothetical protein